MSFDRNRLPDAAGYFEGQGLKLVGRGKWRTTECRFHGGSDSMRVNTQSGAWVCMACAVKGGDVLGHYMQSQEADFITAAKALGAWLDDGKPNTLHRPKPLPAGDALRLLSDEANLIAVAGGNINHGVALSDTDRARVLLAANRIATICEAFQ